jgi:hypothetical protein
MDPFAPETFYTRRMNRWSLALILSALVLSGAGCVHQTPTVRVPEPPSPAPVPPPPPPPAVPTLESHVLGVWENDEKRDHPKKLIFEAGGRLTFEGGLEFYNPGRWSLSEDLQELIIALPEADVDRLRVFQMNLGSGVKAFDPSSKQITYHLDEQTWTLNVGGWVYTKQDVPIETAAPQPPLD